MFVVLLVMAPPSQELEPSAIPGRFKSGPSRTQLETDLVARVFGIGNQTRKGIHSVYRERILQVGTAFLAVFLSADS